MIIKHRNEPKELIILRLLNARRYRLSANEKNYLSNLEKGWKGEKKFDECQNNFSNDWIILNDLLLEHHNNVFQIDTLLINENLHLFEVKNYEGDFYIEDDKWFTLSGAEVKNPLFQLKRSESLLRRLQQSLGFNYSIQAHLIFINPSFFLYKAPLDLPIIFPSQINRMINVLNTNLSKSKDKHLQLAKHLFSIQLKESPLHFLPKYSYNQLKKGIYCAICNTFINNCNKSILVCPKCGHKEKVESAILRSIKEYTILFPKRKITINAVQEWCKIIESKKTIRRILSKHFILKNHGKSSYYEYPSENSASE
ncbi:NERD domain-containing protein [Heyndrickxia sporothermodurans]